MFLGGIEKNRGFTSPRGIEKTRGFMFPGLIHNLKMREKNFENSCTTIKIFNYISIRMNFNQNELQRSVKIADEFKWNYQAKFTTFHKA